MKRSTVFGGLYRGPLFLKTTILGKGKNEHENYHSGLGTQGLGIKNPSIPCRVHVLNGHVLPQQPHYD